MSTPRALVVDDEPQMLSIVTFALETQGFTCVTAPDAEQAWRVISGEHLDLVVLDVMLPGASGVALCRRIRAQSDLPVILLTARAESEERIEGLEAGADDYITKPFAVRELMLRADRLVRRSMSAGRDGAIGALRIDALNRTLTDEAVRLRLSDLELRLLQVLAERHGAVVTWRELLNEVWETSASEGGRQMVKTAVYRLRKRMEAAGLPAIIETVPGVGYRQLVTSTQPRSE